MKRSDIVYIIVGNDIYYKQVRVYDTKDCTTVMVRHKTLFDCVKNGTKVYGLTSSNEILCQSLDVFDELLSYIEKVYAKAIVLDVHDNLFAEMLYKIVAPYGLATKPTDIQASIKKKNMILYCTGHVIQLDTMHVTQLHSIKLEKQFENLDFQTRCMLGELAKIPISLKYDTTVQAISKVSDCAYVVTLDTFKVYVVLFKLYKDDLPLDVSAYIEEKSARFYSAYLESINNGVFPDRPYYIGQLLTHYRNIYITGKPEVLIYERR